MNISINVIYPKPDICVIQIAGEVLFVASRQLRKAIDDIIRKGCTKLIIDLSNVTFLESTAIGELILGLKQIREKDGKLVLICPDNQIKQLFEITGLTNVFKIYFTQTGAIRALEKS